MTDTPKLITIDVAADKYRFIAQMDGRVTCYRNGESWYEGTNVNRGNNMLMAIAGRLHAAEQLLQELLDETYGNTCEELDKDLMERIKTFQAPNPHYPRR